MNKKEDSLDNATFLNVTRQKMNETDFRSNSSRVIEKLNATKASFVNDSSSEEIAKLDLSVVSSTLRTKRHVQYNQKRPSYPGPNNRPNFLGYQKPKPAPYYQKPKPVPYYYKKPSNPAPAYKPYPAPAYKPYPVPAYQATTPYANQTTTPYANTTTPYANATIAPPTFPTPPTLPPLPTPPFVLPPNCIPIGPLEFTPNNLNLSYPSYTKPTYGDAAQYRPAQYNKPYSYAKTDFASSILPEFSPRSQDDDESRQSVDFRTSNKTKDNKDSKIIAIISNESLRKGKCNFIEVLGNSTASIFVSSKEENLGYLKRQARKVNLPLKKSVFAVLLGRKEALGNCSVLTVMPPFICVIGGVPTMIGGLPAGLLSTLLAKPSPPASPYYKPVAPVYPLKPVAPVYPLNPAPPVYPPKPAPQPSPYFPPEAPVYAPTYGSPMVPELPAAAYPPMALPAYPLPMAPHPQIYPPAYPPAYAPPNGRLPAPGSAFENPFSGLLGVRSDVDDGSNNQSDLGQQLPASLEASQSDPIN